MVANGICHIILTRFNLPSGGREAKIRESPDWLEKRFQLFETYCLPSVLAQSNLNFTWFIYFDEHTPEPHYSRAKQFEQLYENITLFWETDVTLSRIREQIVSLVDSSADTLLTTRLDNDDALNRNFIDELQVQASQLRQSSPQVLNYPNGMILNNGSTYSHRDKNSPFASLLEPMSVNIRTIWRYQHTQLHRFGAIHQLTSEAMWLQIVHGDNVSNRIRGRRVSNKVLVDSFQFSEPLALSESRYGIILENTFLFPVRQLKEFCRAGLKALLLLVKRSN